MELPVLIFCLLMLVTILSLLFISFAVYFIPIVIAYVRKHNNFIAISLMTIFTGWTFLGWMASLLWSLNSDTAKVQEEDE